MYTDEDIEHAIERYNSFKHGVMSNEEVMEMIGFDKDMYENLFMMILESHTGKKEYELKPNKYNMGLIVGIAEGFKVGFALAQFMPISEGAIN